MRSKAGCERSGDGEIIVKIEIDRRDIAFRLRDAKILVLVVFVLDAVFSQGLGHIELPAMPLPSITLCVRVDGLISGQNLVNGLLLRHLEACLLLGEHIDNPHPP
jgi:hypothetical protein